MASAEVRQPQDACDDANIRFFRVTAILSENILDIFKEYFNYGSKQSRN